ncbi:MAG: glycoside hydrolase [Ardenticatenales bacterium]|nr:glycoside hydrolase [Ardenticatenales bacterium]
MSHPMTRRTLLSRLLALATVGAAPSVRPGGTSQRAALAAAARIYIAPDDHTDYFWTADDETYARVFVETLDFYLDRIDASEAAGLPSAHHARWNCDGWLWVREYEEAKDAAAFDRLIGRIKDGHISVPLNALVLVQGGAPLEAVLRGMFYPGRLERRHDVRLPLAVAMENQTLPYGLGSLWAGSGARYSWKGICGCSSRVPTAGDRPHDIYWWVGPDGQRILMKWHSMLGGNDGSGGYAEIRRVADAIEYVTPGTGDAAFRERYPFDVIGLFGQGWDDLATRSDDVTEAARTLSDARREVRVSNEVDFFTDFEARYGNGIPEHGAAFGNEWDVLIASMNETTARVRRAVERLRSAEALAAVVGLHSPDAFDDLASARDRCFGNLGLYYEHDWTADGQFPREVRAAWQVRLADEIEGYVEQLHDRGTAHLGHQIGAGGPLPAPVEPSAAVERWFVFNPLGWSRTDVVDLAVAGGPRPVRVIDVERGRDVPHQWWSDPFDAAAPPALRVLAADVPSVGYRVLAVVDAGSGSNDATHDGRVALDGDALVNDHFQVDVGADGRLVRLIDRARANRNVGPRDGDRCNALVRRDGGDDGGGAATATRRAAATGPVTAAFAAAIDRPRRHTTAVSVHAGVARIDIDSRIEESFDEVLAWSFGFGIDDPLVWHEEVGAIIAARLLGDGGHYSPRAARYDWLTLNHFAAIGPRTGDGPWIVLANRDCSFFRLGMSTPERLVTDDPRLFALAGGQVDGPTLGIPSQGDVTEHRYRFSVTTMDRFDAAAAMRFALAATNPLVAGRVTSSVGGRPSDTWGLLTVSDPDVLLWALKPAEDAGPGHLSVRLWNLADRPATPLVRIRPPHALTGALRTTHIETPIAPEGLRGGALPAELGKAELGTWQLSIGRPARTGGQVIWLPELRNDV